MKIWSWNPIHFEQWDYRQCASGIGGSEQHAAEMAWRLQRRGHDVTVFAPIPDDCPREWRGTKWKGLDEADFTEPGLWLLYRCPEVLDQFSPIDAQQPRWFISQDEHYGPRLTQERADKIDKYMVLSPWHKEIIDAAYPLLGGKVVITSNGIKCDLIAEVEAEGIPKRNPKKLIYASSPDRGLESLIEIFTRAREYEPELELHVFYGLNNIEKLIDFEKRFAHYRAFKERILKAMDRPGIFFHGRVSQKELYREWMTAGIWCYPTEFGETSCQPAGSLIFTKTGMVPIQDIQIGDEVLTHRGRFRKVTETMCRPYDGWMYSVHRRKDHRAIHVTDKHPIAAVSYNRGADYNGHAFNHRVVNWKTDWRGPEALESRDYLTTPKLEQSAMEPVAVTIGTEQKLVDAEFAFILGVYCAEGWVQHRTLEDGQFQLGMIGTAHHAKEIELANQVATYFGGSVRQRGNSLQTESWDIKLARFLVANCGHGARNKKVPACIWDSPREVQEAFLKGLMLGDGCVHNTCNRVSYSTTSESLAYAVVILLCAFGIFAAMNWNRKRRAYDLSWQKNKTLAYHREHPEFFATRIKSITKLHYSGPVYNLEVEEDHSYTTDRTAVHNCITAMECQAMGAIPIFNSYGALKDNVDHGISIPGWPYRDMLTQCRYIGEVVKVANEVEWQNKIREPMMREARKRFDWERFVDQWQKWIHYSQFDAKRGAAVDLHA